jgi:hypothetical protein
VLLDFRQIYCALAAADFHVLSVGAESLMDWAFDGHDLLWEFGFQEMLTGGI